MFKSLIKKSVFTIGTLQKYHKVRNKTNLTVVMFHRVLSENDPRWGGANLEWTVTDSFFEQCLLFFEKHYNIVGLDDLLLSSTGSFKLPDCPLLITFDDGWADNVEFAFPILQKHKSPSVVFLATNWINSRLPFWEEHLYHTWKTGKIDARRLNEALLNKFPISFSLEDDVRQVLATISRLAPDKRCALLEIIEDYLYWPAQKAMLTTDQVLNMVNAGISIGSHGMSHDPIVTVATPHVELKGSFDRIQQLATRAYGNSSEICLSFPHGAYTEEIVQMAYRCGYQLLFSSNPVLNSLSECGKLYTKNIGRISLPYLGLIDNDGELSDQKLAFWLMNRISI